MIQIDDPILMLAGLLAYLNYDRIHSYQLQEGFVYYLNSAMDYLYLRYGMEVCLRSKVSQKYLGYDDQSETANASSMPPYIEIARTQQNTQSERNLPSLKLKIDTRDPTVEKGSVVSFGSKIFLIDCETGSYLTAMHSKKSIGFDKPGIHEGMNAMLQKSATFLVLDEKNVRSRQSVSVYDQVHLKSVMGVFLICLPNGEVNITGESAKAETAWNMMKADTPYIPAWVYQRPTFSKFLNLGQIEVDPLFGRDRKQQLGSQPVNIQEMRLVEDILDVMLGFDGEYIKKDSRGVYSLEPHKDRPTCSLALAELTKKILILPSCYCKIENYISTYSIQEGTVCQALCSGLRQFVKEYKMMAIQFDEEVGTRGVTLQEIWYYIQPSLQLMESIVELIGEAQGKKGGQLITVILKMLNGTTSEQAVRIYNFLFEKCIRVYIQMISKWIYEGVIEDKYQEFMILEDESQRDQKWSHWEDKYMLRSEQVPALFEKDAHLIQVTGKYLNIIKLCSALETHPLHKEIERNLDTHIKNQDFTESILRAYDWANEKLQNLVINEYKLPEILRSMKGYYFLGYGDLFVHFMDNAEEDLNSKNGKFSIDLKTKPISVEKLQNLFELLIRTSSANNDPYKEEISCKLENTTIYEQVHKIKTLEFENLPSDKPFIKKESKIVDYLNLNFNCSFPLSLILNKKTLAKYQVLFRYLFWCKFIERQLNSIWLDLQATKVVGMLLFKKANLLTQKMLNFIKSIIYYLSYEVIEKNWRILQINLSRIKNFEEILKYHNEFLITCLQESLLINSKLLPIITNELGGSCQGFIQIKKYVEMFNPENISWVPDPKDSILTQRLKKRKQLEISFQQFHDTDFQEFITNYNNLFDKNMKKLLREIYAMVDRADNGDKKEESSHLVGLLDTLDPKKFYNRLLFEEKKTFMYQ